MQDFKTPNSQASYEKGIDGSNWTHSSPAPALKYPERNYHIVIFACVFQAMLSCKVTLVYLFYDFKFYLMHHLYKNAGTHCKTRISLSLLQKGA